MLTSLSFMQVAYLMTERWHIADLLLYGVASLALIPGIGLFVWGRAERSRGPNHVHADDQHRHGPLLLDPSRQ
jgi:hypothetical protein